MAEETTKLVRSAAGTTVKTVTENGILKIVEAVHPEVRRERTRNRFDRDEQLGALMEQVKVLSDHLGVDLVPRFAQAWTARTEILAENQVMRDKYTQEFGN